MPCSIRIRTWLNPERTDLSLGAMIGEVGDVESDKFPWGAHARTESLILIIEDMDPPEARAWLQAEGVPDDLRAAEKTEHTRYYNDIKTALDAVQADVDSVNADTVAQINTLSSKSLVTVKPSDVEAINVAAANQIKTIQADAVASVNPIDPIKKVDYRAWPYHRHYIDLQALRDTLVPEDAAIVQRGIDRKLVESTEILRIDSVTLAKVVIEKDCVAINTSITTAKVVNSTQVVEAVIDG